MKKNFIFIFLLLLAVILVGCNKDDGGSEDGVIRLTYWNPITGPDGAKMKQIIKLFNEEHKDKIEVVDTPVAENDHYTNMDLLIPMGKGPDIALMHSHRVESYKRSNLIISLDEYVTESKLAFNEEDYISNVYNSLLIDNKLYGIPLDVHPIGIYYNKSLLEKYNQAVPTNREELISVAKAIQTAEQALGNDVWGIPISTVWPSEWLYTSALFQNAGLDVDLEGNPAFDTNAGRAALKAVTDLVHVEKLSKTALNVDQDLFYFQQGKAVFHFNGSWMLESMVSHNINFGVIPVSAMFATSGSGDHTNDIYVRSHTFVLPKQTRSVSSEKKTAIMTFIKFMGDHSYLWATAGQIPASNAARSTDEYKALPYHGGFGEIENFRVSGKSPYYLEAFGPIYERVTTALTNSNYNAEILVKEAVEEARKIIAELR